MNQSELLVSVNNSDDTITIRNFCTDNFIFEFADGISGIVNAETAEFTESLSEEEIIQANAEVLDEIYADDMGSSEFFTENENIVISEISNRISVDDETDEIADQTDIQLMILTENMAVFGDDSNVYDSMNLDSMNSDITDMSQLLVGNSVQ